ncbi:MAG: RNA polymerase sigma factor [Gammaproteobacteria bacterium]
MLEFSPCEAEVLIEKYRRELHAFLLRRVNCPETANDLLQEIFLRLVNLKSSEPIRNPRAFVYKIAANLAADHLRQRRDNVDLDDIEVLEVADTLSNPETIVNNAQQIGLCERALSELSPLCLKILIMSRFEGRSHKHIAEELGISVSWVEKNIIAALKQCKRALDEAEH